MTAKQLSKKTGFHRKTLIRWARENVIPGLFIGGSKGWLFDLGEVQAAIRVCKGNKAQRRLLAGRGIR